MLILAFCWWCDFKESLTEWVLILLRIRTERLYVKLTQTEILLIEVLES
jgi:hypothetical protein